MIARVLAMPSPAPEGLAPLLAPVSPESPAGEWLRFDAVYDDVRQRREADDPTLPQGVWQRELKRADWTGVAELCGNALAGRSKDLQLAAWLTEAWIHLHGFPGLERGLRLLAGLCRGFWDTLHPPLDEDGSLEARVAPLLWVVDRLPLAVKGVPVTAPGGEDSAPFGWVDWEAGLYLANLARLDTAAAGKAQASGMVPQDRFLVSVSLTPAPWMSQLAREVAAALAAVDELDALLAGCCAEEAPSLSSLRNPLQAIHAFAARVLEDRGEPLAPLEPDGGQAPPAQGGEGMGSADPTGRPAGILNRADAYRQLVEAADYLLRTEPHSPVPYLVRRAVSWGHMSLAELLQELLQKNADLGTLYTLLGIKRSS